MKERVSSNQSIHTCNHHVGNLIIQRSRVRISCRAISAVIKHNCAAFMVIELLKVTITVYDADL